MPTLLSPLINELDAQESISLKRLQKAAVVSATHEAGHEFQRPGCHEGTRLAVFSRLMDWVIGNYEPEAIFLWLYGDAGAGKSSIAQTFAVRCAQERHLLASFFFWKNDPQRSSHTALIATLIHQAITIIPALRVLVAAAIDRDPSILEKHLTRQIMSLLIEPLNVLVSTPDFDASSSPTLILIDGLDECTTANAQRSILEAFAAALPHCRYGIKLLIASRPELEINATFNTNPFNLVSSRVALSASFKADEDIRKFLLDTFNKIKLSHPHSVLIPASWPSDDVIPTIVRRSGGQFILPSTIAKYVSDPHQKPMEQLDTVMAVRPDPFDANIPNTELNALYTHALSRVPSYKIERSLEILSFTVIVSPILDPQVQPQIMVSLLSLEPGDTEFYLADLTSLVQVQYDKDLPSVRILHASFGDFLLDPQRSHKFHCDPGSFFAKISGYGLELLTKDGLCHICIIASICLLLALFLLLFSRFIRSSYQSRI